MGSDGPESVWRYVFEALEKGDDFRSKKSE